MYALVKMKTKILYGNPDLPKRAMFKTDRDSLPEKQREFITACFFRPAHKSVERSFNINTLKSCKEEKTLIPDMVVLGHCSYHVKNGKVVDSVRCCGIVRVITDDYVNQIDAMDNQIAALKKQQIELLAEAARHGRQLRIEEI